MLFALEGHLEAGMATCRHFSRVLLEHRVLLALVLVGSAPWQRLPYWGSMVLHALLGEMVAKDQVGDLLLRWAVVETRRSYMADGQANGGEPAEARCLLRGQCCEESGGFVFGITPTWREATWNVCVCEEKRPVGVDIGVACDWWLAVPELLMGATEK